MAGAASLDATSRFCQQVVTDYQVTNAHLITLDGRVTTLSASILEQGKEQQKNIGEQHELLVSLVAAHERLTAGFERLTADFKAVADKQEIQGQTLHTLIQGQAEMLAEIRSIHNPGLRNASVMSSQGQ